MDFFIRLLGAVVITYFVSRGTLFALKRLRGNASYVVTAHTASWVLIELAVGLAKSNIYTPFAVSAGLIYLGPQLVWMIVDLARGLGKSAPGSVG
jgi:hypothetical protein